MMSRKLLDVYQTHEINQNDTTVNVLPYVDLRKSVRTILARMSKHNNSFLKAMMMRTGSLGTITDAFENDFQMLNVPQEGVLKAYRIFRSINDPFLYSLCIQCYLPPEIEGSNEDLMHDDLRLAVMN